MVIAPDRETHLRIIRGHLPRVPSAAVELRSGWDHHVYLVHDRGAMHVFRFPQRPRLIDPMRKVALDWLAATGEIPFPLPAFTIHVDDDTGVQYERMTWLRGEPFTAEVAATFSPPDLDAIADQLAGFLNALHGFPLDHARRLGVPEMDPSDYRSFMEYHPHAWPRIADRLWPVIGAAERAWLERLFAPFLERRWSTPLPLTVRHSDLFPYHIFVDETRRVSGIIDFGWRIADPANDFKAFTAYGDDFLPKVYARYRHPVDPEFDARRLFYSGHDETFELVRAYELNDAARIARQRESFAAFVAAHPLADDDWFS